MTPSRAAKPRLAQARLAKKCRPRVTRREAVRKRAPGLWERVLGWLGVAKPTPRPIRSCIPPVRPPVRPRVELRRPAGAPFAARYAQAEAAYAAGAVAKAVRLMRPLADAEHVPAVVWMAWRSYEGDAGPIDLEAARRWAAIGVRRFDRAAIALHDLICAGPTETPTTDDGWRALWRYRLERGDARAPGELAALLPPEEAVALLGADAPGFPAGAPWDALAATYGTLRAARFALARGQADPAAALRWYLLAAAPGAREGAAPDPGLRAAALFAAAHLIDAAPMLGRRASGLVVLPHTLYRQAARLAAAGVRLPDSLPAIAAEALEADAARDWPLAMARYRAAAALATGDAPALGGPPLLRV